MGGTEATSASSPNAKKAGREKQERKHLTIGLIVVGLSVAPAAIGYVVIFPSVVLVGPVVAGLLAAIFGLVFALFRALEVPYGVTANEVVAKMIRPIRAAYGIDPRRPTDWQTWKRPLLSIERERWLFAGAGAAALYVVVFTARGVTTWLGLFTPGGTKVWSSAIHLVQLMMPSIAVFTSLTWYALRGQKLRKIAWGILASEGVPICADCGYDLRGGVTKVCPECGTISPQLSTQPERNESAVGSPANR